MRADSVRVYTAVKILHANLSGFARVRKKKTVARASKRLIIGRFSSPWVVLLGNIFDTSLVSSGVSSWVRSGGEKRAKDIINLSPVVKALLKIMERISRTTNFTPRIYSHLVPYTLPSICSIYL